MINHDIESHYDLQQTRLHPAAQDRRVGPVVFGLAEAFTLVDHRQQPAELLQSNILSRGPKETTV